MARRRLVLLAAVASALAAAGCTAMLDTEQAAGELEKEIERQTGAELAAVECPEDVEAKQGSTFRCTVRGADGTTVTIDVEQTSDEGDIAFDAPLLHVRDAEEQLASSIGGGAEVTCPELILVEAGATFTCEATSGSDTATVTATFKDDQGNFEYEVAE